MKRAVQAESLDTCNFELRAILLLGHHKNRYSWTHFPKMWKTLSCNAATQCEIKIRKQIRYRILPFTKVNDLPNIGLGFTDSTDCARRDEFSKTPHQPTSFSFESRKNRQVTFISGFSSDSRHVGEYPQHSQLNTIIKRVITRICVDDFSSIRTTALFAPDALRRD